MARLNSKASSKKVPNTVNAAGGAAFKQTDKLEFVSLLLTSLLQGQYYSTPEAQMARVEKLVGSISDKKFLAKAAIFARNEFGMRSITHVAAAEIAKTVKGESWTKDFLDKVIHRPDDMTETLAYYLSKYKAPIPNSLKKGFAKAFNRFEAYQLAKYRGEGKEVTLIDVVNLCHPKPTRKNSKALKALMKGNLKSSDTWESMLTQAGQNAENDEEKAEMKADVWKTLLTENKLGYFAALRNINNIMEQGDTDTFKLLLDTLTNEKMIAKSLVFPYRFLTAINNLKGSDDAKVRKAKVALNKALDLSCKNVPEFDGETLVVCDYSGSMGDGIDSNRGEGSLFGAIVAKANNADFMIFGDSGSLIKYNPANSTMTIAEEFMKNNQHNYQREGGSGVQVGHGTNFGSIFTTATKKYNRIIIFSDMQPNIGTGEPGRARAAYEKKFNCKPHVYAIDLTGHGTSAFPENRSYQLAGFSDKIFDIMKFVEEDRNALVNKIESVEI
jgi:60 kDa SS-A/Ro ribonucleoprotein